MLSKKASTSAKRPYASCLDCKRLMDNCILKEDILSTTKVVSNFAREGCVKYKGNPEEEKPVKEIIKERLLSGDLICVKKVSIELGIEDGEFYRYVKQLRRSSILLECVRKSDKTYYKLKSKPSYEKTRQKIA